MSVFFRSAWRVTTTEDIPKNDKHEDTNVTSKASQAILDGIPPLTGSPIRETAHTSCLVYIHVTSHLLFSVNFKSHLQQLPRHESPLWRKGAVHISHSGVVSPCLRLVALPGPNSFSKLGFLEETLKKHASSWKMDLNFQRRISSAP